MILCQAISKAQTLQVPLNSYNRDQGSMASSNYLMADNQMCWFSYKHKPFLHLLFSYCLLSNDQHHHKQLQTAHL